MMQVEYKGQKGIVEAERNIVDSPFITWYVRLDSGELVADYMYNFIILSQRVSFTK